MTNGFANIRKDYLKNTLDEKQINNDPIKQFQKWLHEAMDSEPGDSTAMVLSTVSDKGFPSSRIVLLKEVNSRGFVFFTNYNSRKGKHIQQNPNATILFFWKDQERQVRIEGIVEKIDASESDDYFYSRPVESQISAIVSPQSEKIPNRESLEQLRNDFISSGNSIKRPENWGGYILIPKYFEFWQGRLHRLHDRITYCSDQKKDWKISRLAS
jgi:pyridoxamine 5'-phosphate oxidase